MEMKSRVITARGMEYRFSGAMNVPHTFSSSHRFWPCAPHSPACDSHDPRESGQSGQTYGYGAGRASDRGESESNRTESHF